MMKYFKRIMAKVLPAVLVGVTHEVPYVIKIEYNGETYDIYYNWDLNQELDLVEIEDIVQKLNNGKYEIKTLK